MPILEQSWNNEANTLGYENEKEMLRGLYLEQAYSINQIALVLGFSAFNIRRRLLTWGIQLRHRGGPNNKGRRRLKALSDEELFGKPPVEIAVSQGVHIATVFAEKRLRQKEAVEVK